MFALIETKNATHIAINVPLEGADKTLPALAAMLENNAVFIQVGYRDIQSVQPSMSIVLGDKLSFENSETELAVAKSPCVIPGDFVIESPEVLVSNAKALKAKDLQIEKQRTENAFLKQEMETLQAKLADLVNANQGDDGE